MPPKPDNRIPNWWVEFYWTPEHTSPDESVFDMICVEAGYSNFTKDEQMGFESRMFETRDSLATIESKFKKVIDSGYPYKGNSGEGVISRVKVERLAFPP